MISDREIAALSTEWSLRHDVIEKDYVLGWLLAGIAAHPALAGWVFKGGTCLRKCYFETYRFSEDLDFTIASGSDEPESLASVFAEIGPWIDEQCGIGLQVDERSFRRQVNRRGNPTTRGRLAFTGPMRSPSTPKVQLDLTTDELVAEPVVLRPIFHPYSDGAETWDGTQIVGETSAYGLVELFAEKLRALAERCRPRDLYDVVHTHRHPDLLGRAGDVHDALERKCEYVGIAAPTLDSILSSPHRQEIEQEWGNMLAHQLPQLPPFEQFWESLADVFEWLEGRRALPVLPHAVVPGADVDVSWRMPRTMVSWRESAPIELIRFAGANRLKIEVDYRAERGRQGPRLVSPLSFQRSRQGRLLLYLINDYGQLRSYGVDRIAGVSVTREPFDAPYAVEF
jgi:predicted nucleotidyltransferase component of viral defense system